MTAAEDQGWKKPRDEDEAERLLLHKPRWCAICKAFGTHHTDGHNPEPVASKAEARAALAEARALVRRASMRAVTTHTSRTHEKSEEGEG